MSDGNGHTPKLHDAELEHWFVTALITEPAHLPRIDVGVDDLQDPHARWAMTAVRNVSARGDVVTPESVRAELVRDEKTITATYQEAAGLPTYGTPNAARTEPPYPPSWYDKLLASAPPQPFTLFSWQSQILRLAEIRRAAIDAGDEDARIQAEIDRAALDDAEPAAPPEPPPAPKPRWLTPLIEFLGNEEPSDDDSEEWIIRDMIPRAEPSLFVGRAKGGKTWAMLSMAICIAMGLPWLGKLGFANTMGGPARVLVIALEDSQRRLRKRIWELCRAMGLSPNDKTLQANLIISRQPLRLPDRSDQKAIGRELMQWRPAAVLLDNLTRIMSGDQNKTQDASLFCNLWLQMCTHVGANFTYVHHVNKTPGEKDGRGKVDPFERIRGAGAFVDAARHLVLTTPLEIEGREISEVRMRGNLDIGREPFLIELEREMDGQGRRSVHLRDRGDATQMLADLARSTKETQAKLRSERTQSEYQRRRQVAIDLMTQNRKLSSRDLAKALQLGERTAAAVLNDLMSDGVFRRDKNNGYAFAEEADS